MIFGTEDVYFILLSYLIRAHRHTTFLPSKHHRFHQGNIWRVSTTVQQPLHIRLSLHIVHHPSCVCIRPYKVRCWGYVCMCLMHTLFL